MTSLDASVHDYSKKMRFTNLSWKLNIHEFFHVAVISFRKNQKNCSLFHNSYIFLSHFQWNTIQHRLQHIQTNSTDALIVFSNLTHFSLLLHLTDLIIVLHFTYKPVICFDPQNKWPVCIWNTSLCWNGLI